MKINKAKIRLSNRFRSLYKHYISKKGCKDCGIKGPYGIFQFDHTDGSTTQNRMESNIGTAHITRLFYSYTLKKAFAALRLVDIICANCHQLRSRKRGQFAKGGTSIRYNK